MGLILLGLAYSVSGQGKNQEPPYPVSLSGQYPQIYLSIPAKLLTAELAERVSIDFIDRSRAYLYVNKEAFSFITLREIEFRIEKSPGEVAYNLNMVDVDQIFQKDLTLAWNFYPTYDAYVALMYRFEEDYPDLVKIHKIGTTVDGRLLLFAQIKPEIDKPAPLPQVMYTSTMHGDETAGFVTLLRLIHFLASSYGNNNELTDLMNQLDIWICPNENPDGTYTKDNSTISGAIRFNANGKDLNRNYPGPHPSYPNPPEMPLQPETLAMMDFVRDRNFVLSANIHGGIELVNYPWDAWKSTQQTHADHDWWGFTMDEFVDTVHYYSTSTYMRGLGTGVTHGGDWYVVYGSRQDYMNYFHSIREFTLEMSNQKLLNPSLLPAHWNYIHRSLINFLRQATYGFHGIVKDADSGEPLQAKVALTGHDSFNSEVKTSTGFGNFTRPVFAGNYNFTFTSDGYDPVILNDIKAGNHQRVELTINMGDNTFPLYVFSSDTKTGTVAGTGVYKAQRVATVTATPLPGYEFSHWQNTDEEVVSYQRGYSFEMPAHTVSLTAVFAPQDERFTVNFGVGGENGIITASVGGKLIDSGAQVTAGSNIIFEAWPANGYAVRKWTINNTAFPGNTDNTYIVENLQDNVEILVEFTPVSITSALRGSYTVKVYPNPGRDRFYIESGFNIRSIELLDDAGRVISTFRTGRTRNTQILLRGIPPGFYLLKISGDEGFVVRKIQVY